MDPKALEQDVRKMLNQSKNAIQLKEEDIIICSKCGGELFVSPVRLAKTKMDFTQEVVGLVRETPRAFCFTCKEELPKDSKGITTKKDKDISLAEVVETKEEVKDEKPGSEV